MNIPFTTQDPEKDLAWSQLYEEVKRCTACGLCRGREHAVVGDGNPRARVMLIGEGPGAEEDRQGLPFVGAAGQLLDRMLEAFGLDRTQIYIANIVKCRPPGNRNPEDSEAKACLPFLRRQLKLVDARILVCMGTVACKHIIDPQARVSVLRGRWIDRKGFSILPTYHPAALLRNDGLMIDSWRDMKLLRARMDELETDQ